MKEGEEKTTSWTLQRLSFFFARVLSLFSLQKKEKEQTKMIFYVILNTKNSI